MKENHSFRPYPIAGVLRASKRMILNLINKPEKLYGGRDPNLYKGVISSQREHQRGKGSLHVRSLNLSNTREWGRYISCEGIGDKVSRGSRETGLLKNKVGKLCSQSVY